MVCAWPGSAALMPTCIQTRAQTVKNDAQAVSNTVVLVVCEQLDSVRQTSPTLPMYRWREGAGL